MECVEVCPDGALEMETQTDDIVGLLRTNHELWNNLPETDSRFVKIANLDEGIGTLSSMMIQRSVYDSMLGGDGACMGCGEKTNIHLFLAALNALMEPRVETHIKMLKGLIADLETRGRAIAAKDVDLARAAKGDTEALELSAEDRAAITQLEDAKKDLADLLWRYEEGPSGRGRAKLAMANSTGCTSVWASTFPYNPYPFPWVNHLFQDSPSIALGVFEGHMRKMADGFISIRRAEAILDGSYDAEKLEPELAKFDWHDFTDEEFHLCPPIVSLGGDGAMLDIGFQNLSRLMASGHPIKVVVLDTQVYSNTGGQACTSGFTGQISDMATYGDGNHGKTERRKELALIAMAHRGVFVAQSSQAMPAHVLKASIRAINTRNPAVLVLHSPCMPEHLIEADAGARQAKLALSSRAYPILIFDPEKAGDTASCLELDGNPAMTKTWSTYKLDYVDDNGQPQKMELPMTIADWAATEGRFKKHFTKLEDDSNAMHYGEYVLLDAEGREGHTPFIYSLKKDATLGRLKVSPEICKLGHERLEFWHELLEIAGRRPSERAHEVVEAELSADLETQLTALRAEYEGKMTALKASYPVSIARSIAKGLLASDDGSKTIAQILAEAPVSLEGIDLSTSAPAAPVAATPVAPAAPTAPAAPAAPVAVAEAPTPVVEEDDDELAIEAYIDTDACTSCNECIQTNEKIFAYNDDGLAEVVDPAGGPFKDIVMAAEKCPVAIIHPGTPLNSKEKGLDEWLKRAEPFN
jgi:pyruvate-ferredoxin/flavodoxin oxidoreductase